jgi:hypothetical protein
VNTCVIIIAQQQQQQQPGMCNFVCGWVPTLAPTFSRHIATLNCCLCWQCVETWVCVDYIEQLHAGSNCHCAHSV